MAQIEEMSGIPDAELAENLAQIKASGGTVLSKNKDEATDTWTIRASFPDDDAAPAAAAKSKPAPKPPGKAKPNPPKAGGGKGGGKGKGKKGK